MAYLHNVLWFIKIYKKKIAELCENYLPGTLLLPQDPSLDSVILWGFFQTKEKEKLIFFVVKWFVFNIKITEIWVFPLYCFGQSCFDKKMIKQHI